MDPTFWIAHILALHLNVPEPVEFKIDELWPSPNKAQIELRADDIWIIKYDKDSWNVHSTNQKRFIIAHELCHTVYEYHLTWDKLSKKEQNKRHKYVDACAKKILRDHKDCRW